jgi:radical SAM protein with 4Fe4S-binding SPASM domain
MIKPLDPNNYKDLLLADFLDSTYFNSWNPKNPGDDDRPYYEIEIMINSRCNLKCKYCYYTAFGDTLHPTSIDQKNLIPNLKRLFEFLDKNQYKPNINIFSGEPFEQKIGYDVINEVVDYYSRNQIKNSLVIPTNFSFIDTEIKTNKVHDLLKRAEDMGVNIFLSASIDGKYCSSNRPYKSGFIRDDDWYDRAFIFAKQYQFGFHPMIYFDEIEHWKDNFLWFMSMMKKHDYSKSTSLYLLEVRNSGWKTNHNKHLYEFSKFVTEYILNNNPDISIDKIIENTADYNYFSAFVDNTNRALPCGYESNVAIRMADMKLYPCHRLQYPEFESAQIHLSDDNSELYIEAKNPEMYIASNGLKSTLTYPICQDCTINHLCKGGCLGAQYETMKDPFIPIPEVCAMEHAKLVGILEVLCKDNRFKAFMRTRTHMVRKQMTKVLLSINN